MDNWYKKAQGMYDTHDRFLYNIKVAVWVPKQMGQEEGYKVLAKRLRRMIGPTGIDTPGVDANISIEGIYQI